MSISPLTNLVSLRKELLDPVLSESCYIARPDYLQGSTWVQVPVLNLDDDKTTHVSLLFGTAPYDLYMSSVIGRVNADDLFVAPQGDCSNPNQITGACLRFSLSSPQINDHLLFDRDFGVALNNLRQLGDSLKMGDVDCQHMIDLHTLRNRIGFYYPLMFQRFSHPVLEKASPFPLHPDYQGSYLSNFDDLLNIPPTRGPDTRRRMLYPIPSKFTHNFLEASSDLYFVPLTVYAPDGNLLDAADVPSALKDAIVQVDFEVSASIYSGMIGKVVCITIL